jgi:crotonobetainyl-CoA:carnitine CoA-transferase CaiB-like acyl-CoA transferase
MASKQPLDGYTVIELGHSVAAPYAGLVLAELGATVIKIENPKGGDTARGWGPPFADGSGPHFKAFNRNKQSVAVDLADPQECQALRLLIEARADVVICNLRAGVAERYGLGSTHLLASKPELVYCEIGAFGSGGPLSHKPGYDPLMQAFCGIMSVTGESADRPPVRVGVSMVDMGAGLWGAIGILGALLERERTGKGGRIETSLFETAVAWAATPIARHNMGGGAQKPQGSGAAGIVPYQAFRTKDNWLVIGAGNDKLFAALCDVMGRPELTRDPRFQRNGDRVVNQAQLLPIIEAFAMRHDSEELGGLLDASSIPNAPVQTIGQIVENAQTEALGLIQSADDGSAATVGLPLRFDGQRPQYRTVAAILGEHTESVLGAFLERSRRGD